MTDHAFYLVEKEAPLAWIWLNRPAKKNAMNPPAWHELPAIMAELDADDAIRAVVIAAKGPAFCAGIDLVAMAAELPELMDKAQTGGVKRRLRHKIAPLQETMTCIERCRKPVICAVHGYCVGAGLDMATACDIRLCSADAVFSLREAAVGFVADVGVLQRLPLIVGQGMARELAFTAANFDARRAREILLVNAVFDDVASLLAGARDLALRIAGNSPLAVQATKDVLNYGVGKSVDDGLRYVAAMSANIIPSEDLFEAMTAFAEKRKPNFSGK
ncbi:MAG: crotonase/enoyl-CoA hydratase family protein [Desulfobacterales bacterium]|jgi:enoyl-CoA hydratase|nr:crotonase/enoyl-CoA hydratase family protein [Desulfobacteraceae bacterium]MDD3991649.1 crotonase/enoyl-CoA hydratase family protein [Desulfobacteraceae bacterium]MDY0311789.1 crotonase/enoyl-CoA hydratase family protein [Desulfobacterales bacterium]